MRKNLRWADTLKSEIDAVMYWTERWRATEKLESNATMYWVERWQTTEKSVIKGRCVILRNYYLPFKQLGEFLYDDR